MIPQLDHPWLPLKMVLVGLPWVVVLIWPVRDALFAAKEADAALSNLLPKAHQPVMDLLFWTEPRQFHECDAQVADQLAGNASFATALVVKPVFHHAAILLAAECNQALAVKSLPCLQRQGCCLMCLLMTYTHLFSP